MLSNELLRILDFVDQTRQMTEKHTSGFSGVDSRWNLISFAIRRHYEGKLITASSMVQASGTSHGSAMRRIHALIDEGLLIKRERTKTGKSFSIHPSKNLIQDFESYALEMKAYVGNSFGFTSDKGSLSDFYFGASYMTSRILSYPSAMEEGIGYKKRMRILSPSDPTFKTLSDFSSRLNEFCGGSLEIVNLPLDQLYDEIISNSTRDQSKYDIIALDFPWLAELASKKRIKNLDKIIRREKYQFADYHVTAWKGASYEGNQYGIPIQPTTELLFYRGDLFEEASLNGPRTTDDVILAAKILNRPLDGRYGIVMNFGEGTPIAHTFMLTMADFGQPIINLRSLGDDFETSNLKGDNFRPQINTEAGYRAAQFLLELQQYSHPLSIKCSWDTRIKLFARGEAAMTYGWSIRSSAFELDTACPIFGKVKFESHPSAKGVRSVSPIGGFCLAIPSNIEKDSVQTSWKTMEYLARPELMKWYVQNGNLSSPRYSTSADPEVKQMSAIIERIDNMEKEGSLKLWPRPSIPEFNEIVKIIGYEIHRLMRGEVSTNIALETAQNRVDELMRAHGRY